MPRKTREAALVVLVLINVILLCTVLAYVLQLPQAHAQAANAGGGQGYLAVSALIEAGGTNAMFVLDPAQQRLYAWAPVRGGQAVTWAPRDMRDLRQDFSKQPTPAVPPRNR